MRILRYILLTLTFTTTLLFSNDLTQEQINAYVDSLGFSEKYYNIHNVKKQKSAFISELMPKIEAENHKIEQEFFTISQILEKSYFEMSHEDKMDLAKISKKYRIKNIYKKDAYRLHVAPIPTSLVLAQAALESAWGKSRFVREANNIFGHWTYKGWGLVPKNRDFGKHHRLKIFKNLQASIAGYMLNLNRNRAYREFQENRIKAIESKGYYTGLEAAKTMIRYSEIGELYVTRLKSVIKGNKLSSYDAKKAGAYSPAALMASAW
jgi:Bax protein